MFAVVDIETTGLDPEHDRITEFAVVITDGKNILSEESFLINPECRISPQIQSLTGITNELLAHEPRFAHFARRIHMATEGHVFVGHNARFDYGFLVSEFRKLGFPYRRTTACTVRLGKDVLPGLPSYRLDALCAKLGITRGVKHRALADAHDAALAFCKLFALSGTDTPEEFLKQSSEPARVPPLLKKADIDSLPSATGVYHFYDAHGSLLYVGKSRNIKERVLSHFAAETRDLRERKMKEQVATIKTQVTGSELVALLLESDQIKALKPLYNRAQRRGRNAIGLFEGATSELGYRQLELRRLDNTESQSESLRAFATAPAARAFVEALVAEHQLCRHLCHTGLSAHAPQANSPTRPCFHYHIDQCLGACLGLEAPAEYNARLQEALGSKVGVEDSFLIVEKGRERGERAVVWVKNGTYQGYGYTRQRKLGLSSLKQLQDEGFLFCIENSDIKRILRTHLSTTPNLKIVLLRDHSRDLPLFAESQPLL